MKKKKNKKRKNKRRKNQINKKQIVNLVILTILLVIFTSIIIGINHKKPKLNEQTTSYISFNNQNTTDMLKIINLKKMSNKKGMSKDNLHYLDLKVEGNKDDKYEIVIYSITNNIDLEYIHYALLDNNTILTKGVLSDTDNSSDGGKNIYQSKINNRKLTLKMWIGENYKEKVQDNSFEVKIKPR